MATTAAAETAVTAKRWTLADAVAAFGRITAEAVAFGFFPAMFGGTIIRGDGSDLDLFMADSHNYREQPDAEGWLRHFGGEQRREPARAGDFNRCVRVRRDGRMYHFVFRKESLR